MNDGNPLSQQFQDEINKAIDKFRDEGLTLGDAIGALEISKMGLWLERKTDYIRSIVNDPGLT